MTSDSSTKQSAMVLIQPPAPPLNGLPSTEIGGGQALRFDESRPPTDPSRKTFSETSRLLTIETSTSAPSTVRYYSSTATGIQNQVDHERVHPWSYRSSTIASGWEKNPEAAHASDPISSRDEIESKKPVFTRLFDKARSLTGSRSSSFMIASTSRPNLGSQRRRHSILRVSTSKPLGEKAIKKSASVEFALYHEDIERLEILDRRATTSNSTPRRLTFEEKEELYKIRPDLEVGPSPFYKEQMIEREQQAQRRMVFAVVGGLLCIMFLMVVYYVLTIA